MIKADTKLPVVLCLQRSTPPFSGDLQQGGAATQGLWIEHQPAGKMVSFSLFRTRESWCLPYAGFLYPAMKKEIRLKFFFIIFDSYYFQLIEAAVFYTKILFNLFRSNLFMFLGHFWTMSKRKTLFLASLFMTKNFTS